MKYKTRSRKPSFIKYLIFIMFKIHLRETFFVLLSLFAILCGIVSVYLSWKYSLIQVSGISLIAILCLLPGVASILFSTISEVVRIYTKHIKDCETSIKYVDTIPVLKVPLTKINLHQSDKEAGFAPFLININRTEELVFKSEKLDEYLWDKDMSIIEDTHTMNNILRIIRSDAGNLLDMLHSHFLASRREKKEFTNESKLCLADDLRVTMDSVKCYKAGYYLSFLTNEISTKILIRNDEYQTVLFDGREYFPITLDGSTNKSLLLPISQSQMCDHIGVSTIGFSKDKMLVLWIQSERAQQSENLAAPTGSGSCDWSDLSPSRSFRETLTNGMERELHEESTRNKAKVTENLVVGTMILGFFRWVRRGGKPEFVGISRLRVNASDLTPNIAEVTRPRRMLLNFPVRSIDNLGSVIDKIQNEVQLSVPLAVNLECLRHYLQKRKDSLNQFLFG